jgi:hypothetical protein
MLKRLYLLLSGTWAFVFIANGATKEGGIGTGDVAIALGPFAIAWLVGCGFRFVVTGSFRRQSYSMMQDDRK